MKVEKIRISVGSAAALGLKKIKTDVYPTTCYLMTYSNEECQGGCLFCPQGNHKTESNAKKLSRVDWPLFSFEIFMESLKHLQNSEKKTYKPLNIFQRVCLQVINYPNFYHDIKFIIQKIHKQHPRLKISAAIPPINSFQMRELKEVGLERICFALDACTPKIFNDTKGEGAGGSYQWEKHQENLEKALDIYGDGYVTTHFIVGLGETEEEMLKQIYATLKKKIFPGIFLFTPIPGTPLEHRERPDIHIFRRIQIARYLLLRSTQDFKRFVFNSEGKLIKIRHMDEDELNSIINNQIAFKTAGCPGCNRPYYTSRPGEEQDGYPRDLTNREKSKIFEELKTLMNEI